MEWIYIMDLVGTLVFAISGIQTAIENKFDVVGAAIIGLVTAVGGGTLRDILIGTTPVGWLMDVNYIIVVFVAMILSYVFRTKIQKLRKGMFIFDTIGIGLFTILGVEKAMGANLPAVSVILMGVTSAVFGGVIRDVLTNIVPLIFRREIYATACVAGAIVYMILIRFVDNSIVNLIVSMGVVSIIRYFAVKKNWSLYYST